MTSDHLPYLTLSPIRDKDNRRILLLHSDALPSTPPSDVVSSAEGVIIDYLSSVSDSPHVLLYLHAGIASTGGTTLAGVRLFGKTYEEIVPPSARENVQLIVAVHVSFASRTQIYTASFSSAGQDYSRLEYCDLLEDVERRLGVDASLLGIRPVDFEYDDVMRAWVGRSDETNGKHHNAASSVDPSKPLLDYNKVSFEMDNAASSQQTSEEQSSRLIEEP